LIPIPILIEFVFWRLFCPFSQHANHNNHQPLVNEHLEVILHFTLEDPKWRAFEKQVRAFLTAGILSAITIPEY
jgi:hypothetical protein